ncbi:MAG: hypothetical protein J6A38_03005 [Clostridia bacterium]|nr:hypothetical protein [Clostridia bacterium]
MLHKIDPKRLRKKLLFKYFYQFLPATLLYGTILSLGIFFVALIKWGPSQVMWKFFVEEPWYIGGYIGIVFCIIMGNVLSIITSIKLMIDKIDCVIKKDIEVVKIFPNFELNGMKERKRFMYDNYSKKKNVELLLYERENGKKKKYRLFLHEDWGDVEKFGEILQRTSRFKIAYLKHSKIIVRIEEDTDLI